MISLGQNIGYIRHFFSGLTDVNALTIRKCADFIGRQREPDNGNLKMLRKALLSVILIWSAEAMATDFTLPVLRHERANGMVVLTLEDHSVPVTTFYAFYRVGSRNERPGITGLSHFFEHMMFNGADKYGPKMFDKMLEESLTQAPGWNSAGDPC